MTDLEQPQQALFDTSGKQYNINFVDQNQPLLIPNNPLHWKAHKYQVLIARIEKQFESNPAQANSKTYIETLDAFEKCIEEIKRKESDENLGSQDVDGNGDSSTAQDVGTRIALGVGNGVSTDNPLAG